jgi:hypothetical protein
MLRKTLLSTITLVVTLFFTNCVSVRKTIENGDYDKAIDIAVNQLKGKKKKNEEVIKGLELALDKANGRDLAIIDQLVAENNPRHWERINGLYQTIQYRQAKIAPLLPLVGKKGYVAQLNFVEVANLERDSRKKAAEYLYTHAKDLLKSAENGDRVAARDAYFELKKINCLLIEFCDTEALILKAQALGTTHILVEMRNESAVALPREFEYRMMHLSKNDLESAWLSYHFDKNDREVFDYKVVIKLNNINVSPERINERDYTDEKTVEDGWEYIVDAKGNVKKDSLGNDLKKKRFVTVRAYVREVYQTKAAKVGGDLEIYDFKSKALLDKDRLSTEMIFDHYASTFNGDRRALSSNSCSRVGSRPVPFPSDFDMLNDAADRLKPILRDRLKVSRMII